MTRITIFGNADPGVATAVDSNAVNLATAFYITAGAGTAWRATGIRFWMNSDSAAISTGYIAYLLAGSNLATATQVATANFGTINKGAWNEVLFQAGININVSAGTYYWAVVYFPQGSYIAQPSKFSDSVLSVESANFYGASTFEVSPGNGSYDYGAAGDLINAAAGTGAWYGVDVILNDAVMQEGDNTMVTMDYSTYGKLPRAFTPGSSYSAGQQVVSPTNEIVSAKIAFTAGTSYLASDWNIRTATTAAIAAPTAPGAAYAQAEAASMKTAVDAIRAALIANGITL